MSGDREGLTDRRKLLFGAGFVFGVMVTMVMLAVVLVVVGSENPTAVRAGAPLAVTAVGGAVFAAIVGISLFYLAFPENRTQIPVDADQFDRFGSDVDEADRE